MNAKYDFIDSLMGIANSDEFFQSWLKYQSSNSNYIEDLIEGELKKRVEDEVEDAGVNYTSPEANAIELKVYSDSALMEELKQHYYKMAHDEMVDDISYALSEHLEVGPNGVRLYRCVSVEDGEEFSENLKKGSYKEKYSGVGVFWSFSGKAAECHWGYTQGEEQVILVGSADISSINLDETVAALMDLSLGRDELEIRLKEGSPVLIEKIDTDSGDFSVDRVLRAYKERFSSRHIYYHGTSSTFLGRIKETGLNPHVKHKVYEKGYGQDTYKHRSLETFGGVYLTTDPYVAVNSSFNSCMKFGGNPLFIVVAIDSESKNLLIDEDTIITMLTKASGFKDWSDVEQDLSVNFSGTGHEVRKLVEKELKNRDFPHYVDEFREYVGGYIQQTLLEDLDADKLLSDFDSFRPYVTDALKKLALHLVDTEYKEDPDYLFYDKGFDAFRRSIDVLSKKLSFLTKIDEGGEKSVRYKKPITFKGKNRIIGLVEFVPKWEGELGDYTINTFKTKILYDKENAVKNSIESLNQYVEEQGHGGTYYKPSLNEPL